MDFNKIKELQLDSNVLVSTSFTQISTFEEKMNTSTMIEHLQGPNALMCSTSTLPTPCAFPSRLQCTKWLLVHHHDSKSALVHSKAPNESLSTSKARNQPLCTPRLQISSCAPWTLKWPPPNTIATKSLHSQLTWVGP